MAERERVLMDEVEQAQPRVGQSPTKRLQWALDFARRNLDELNSFDWANLRRQLAAFSGSGASANELTKRYVLEDMKRWGTHKWGAQTYCELPTDAEIRSAQAEFRRIIEALLTRGRVQVGPFETTYHLDRRHKTEIPPTRKMHFSSRMEGGLPGVGGLAHLLGSAYGALVEVCPEVKCGRWFVAGRTNQVYCSTLCQSRATTRAHRERAKQTVKRRVPRGNRKRQTRGRAT